jgi:steroid delta-isomerase-like uncharacterized protein
MLITVAIAVSSVLAAGPIAAQSSQGHEKMVRAMFDEVWNDASFDQLGAMLAPEFRFHFRGRATPMDTQKFREMVDAWRTIFPDLRFTLEDVVVNGDRAAARLTFTGTHRSEAWDIQPTGKTVNVTMMAFFRFADGRIAELWEDYDEQGLRQQLTRS